MFIDYVIICCNLNFDARSSGWELSKLLLSVLHLCFGFESKWSIMNLDPAPDLIWVLNQLTFTCSKSKIETLKVWDMFKIMNKNARTISVTYFRGFYRQLWTYFTPFSSVSIVDFEQVSVKWETIDCDIELIIIVDVWERLAGYGFYMLKLCDFC